jgi:predicted 2-oxoglutarate/Fe(II)-dependent dioxygenase YbiX
MSLAKIPGYKRVRRTARTARIGPNIYTLQAIPNAVCARFRTTLEVHRAWRPSPVLHGTYGLDAESTVSTDNRYSFSAADLDDDAIYRRISESLASALCEVASQLQFSDYRLSDTDVVKYTPSGFFSPHRDRNGPDDPRLLTAVGFINDNFDGGVLSVLLRQVLLIKPKLGSVVVFPSEYLHRSELVTRGNKYIAVRCLLRHHRRIWVPTKQGDK